MRAVTRVILITAFIYCNLSNSVSGQTSDWFWQNPLPQGNDLSSVSFIDEFTGYVVGDAGTIIKTTDGGDSWTLQSSSSTKYFYGVSFATAENGIAVTWDEIFITSDGGNTGYL